MVIVKLIRDATKNTEYKHIEFIINELNNIPDEKPSPMKKLKTIAGVKRSFLLLSAIRVNVVAG